MIDFEHRNVSEFTIEKKLGKGTFGTVFLAFDETKQEMISMKKVRLK